MKTFSEKFAEKRVQARPFSEVQAEWNARKLRLRLKQEQELSFDRLDAALARFKADMEADRAESARREAWHRRWDGILLSFMVPVIITLIVLAVWGRR